MSSHPCRPHRCVPRVCGGLDGRIAAAVVVARGGGDGADEDPQQNGKKKSWWPWPRRGEPPLWRWRPPQRQVPRQWPCPRAGGDQEGLCAGVPTSPAPHRAAAPTRVAAATACESGGWGNWEAAACGGSAGGSARRRPFQWRAATVAGEAKGWWCRRWWRWWVHGQQRRRWVRPGGWPPRRPGLSSGR